MGTFPLLKAQPFPKHSALRPTLCSTGPGVAGPSTLQTQMQTLSPARAPSALTCFHLFGKEMICKLLGPLSIQTPRQGRGPGTVGWGWGWGHVASTRRCSVTRAVGGPNQGWGGAAEQTRQSRAGRQTLRSQSAKSACPCRALLHPLFLAHTTNKPLRQEPG